MNKREEIREIIDAYTDDACLYPDKNCENHGKAKADPYCVSADGSYNCLMKRLSELGCAIIVEGELPPSPYHYYSKHDRTNRETEESFCDIGYGRGQQNMFEAGYQKTIPLIGGE